MSGIMRPYMTNHEMKSDYLGQWSPRPSSGKQSSTYNIDKPATEIQTAKQYATKYKALPILYVD
jgi:hypothetical protein